MDTLEPILSEHPLLKNFSEGHMQLITSCTRNVRFNEGDYIFRAGQQADKFYLIRAGKVALDIFSPTVGAITVQTLNDGEVLGWSWLIPPYRWHFDAQVMESTRAFEIDGKCLRTKCESNSDLGYQIMKQFAQIMAQRIHVTQMQLLDIYGTKY